MDENTLFGIASNSKAFTAAALAILVDEGKLDWTDRVVDYIPGFRLYSPFVTEEFNIKGYHPPIVVKEDECLYCQLCEAICPEYALFVTLKKEEEEGEKGQSRP